MAASIGYAPMPTVSETGALLLRHEADKWSEWPGMIRQPPGPKPGALPIELHSVKMVWMTGYDPAASPTRTVRSTY